MLATRQDVLGLMLDTTRIYLAELLRAQELLICEQLA